MKLHIEISGDPSDVAEVLTRVATMLEEQDTFPDVRIVEHVEPAAEKSA